MSETMNADVVIVGAGPCGVTLANYLGVYGIDTLLIERSEEVLDYPRAVGADDEALRSWQGIGLAQDLLHDMIQNAPARYYNSKGICFAEVAPGDQPFGWPRRNLFIQPLTEVTLRKGIARFKNVRVELGMEVENLQQHASGVVLQAKDRNGQPRTIEARYVVGADGGRSTVRGLINVQLDGKTHTNKWLVIDVLNDPLYAPFTAIHCHPERPSISIHLPYGYRRLEFQLKQDEKDETILEPANLEKLLRPHYKGFDKLPEIKRARIYLHHSRIAEKFSVGRVFLAGDAAHLQPPFFGQGMNSGLRDATNLAWKLAWVVQNKASPRMLESYNSERRDHALTMVNFATWIGSFYKPNSRFSEFFRDIFFKSIQKLPGAKEYVLQLKFKPMSRYVEGVVLHQPENLKRKDNPVGRMFMQPTLQANDKAVKLDDLIGPHFCVVGVNIDPCDVMSESNATQLRQMGFETLCVRPSKSIGNAKKPSSTSLEAEDLHGKFRDWILKNPQWEFVILRPDRYVAAVCSAQELNATLKNLIHLIK
ncbi:bifunctional 3-(3-hydroxy-phenyl)propionate/3-hydroxycinnamic acid hydroxylase [Polaromonas sp.]|uniref:bifunctional 3-(3-hydroxy-phenyl)propionate/3-hydroxycinnamic acid hydroxylase n=1 Tax=Polaromonas sp. TaxID=1869339 RepID=UPI003BAB9B23